MFSNLIRLFFKNPLEKLFSGRLAVFRRKRLRKRESKSQPKIELLEVRLTPTSAPFIDLSSFQPQKKEIAFIDSGVSAEKAFLESISPTIEVVEINALSSGLEQIAKVVANRSGLEAIHVFSHGASGKLFLGNTAYTSDNIGNYQNLLRSIGSSLSTDGDILLYGCNIGDSSGLAFVNQFGSFTGADIAASNNLTGNSKYGGDWILEFHTGEINTASLKSQSFVGTLAQITVTTIADTVNPSDGVTSLREAIDLANNLVGDHKTVGNDEIVFASSLFTNGASNIILQSRLLISEAGYGGVGAGNSSLAITGPGPSLLTISLGDYALFKNTEVFRGGGNFSISGVTISAANSSGNGIAIKSSGTLSVTNSIITGNGTRVIGIQNGSYGSYGTATITNSIITGNQSGGIINYNGSTLTINNSIISNNSNNSGVGGAGITNGFVGILTVNNCTISGNSNTNGGGGGIYNKGTATVSNSTLSNNSAKYSGGGIYNKGNFTLSNSTLFGNISRNGAIANSYGTLNIFNSTISGNKHDSYGSASGISIRGGTLNIANTISANNIGSDFYNHSVSNGIINLISPATGSSNLVTQSGIAWATTVTSAQLMLGPLQDNGGSTFTMALGAGSVAIGAGNTTISNASPVFRKDQRNYIRSSTAPSIGAYELNGTYLAPTLTTFAVPVATTNEDIEVAITFADLLAQSDAADIDGNVSAFVVKAVSTGTMKIGTSAGVATAWNVSSNATIDATKKAYWTPASNFNGTLNAFTAVAKDDSGLESATAVQVVVSVSLVNDAPVITTSNSLSYTEAGAAAAIQPSLTLADVDDTQITGGSISIASLVAGDTLRFTNTGTITGIFSGGVLTLTGTDTLANYQAALRGICFSSTSNDPTVNGTRPTRTVTFSVIDANGSSGANGQQTGATTSIINITGTNSAPVLADTALSITVPEDGGIPVGAVGSLISSLVGGITDADTSALQGIAITASVETNGSWYYSTNNGITWSLVGTVSSTSALLLFADASTRIYYNSTAANYNGTRSAVLTFKAWDGTTGTASSKVNPGTYSATVAFSSSTDTIDVVVTAVNDAPLLSGSNPVFVSIAEDLAGSLITGRTVTNLVNALFSDAADTVIGGTSANTLAGIAIVAYIENSAKGAWQYSTDAGATWTVIFTVSSATSAITLTASDMLRFAPKPDFYGAVPVLTFVAIENSTTVTSGAIVDASVRGGSASFSSATLAITQTVTAVVDIVADSLSVNEDSSVTANLITGTNGANADNFENSDRAITAVTQGTRGSVTFNADGTVIYTPAANWNGVDTFTYTVTSCGALETATVIVTVNPINDAPVATGSTATIAAINEGTANSSAVQFNGTSAYMATTISPLSNVTNFTISFWLKVDRLTGWQSLVSEPGIIDVSLSDSKIYVYNPLTNQNSFDISSVLATNTWMHIAITGSQSTAYRWNNITVSHTDVYVNGVQVGTTWHYPLISNYGISTEFLRVGAFTGNGSPAGPLQGSIDELSVWTVTKSASEVSALRTQPPSGSESGLAGYWSMNEGTDTTAYNSKTGATAASNFLFYGTPAPTWTTSNLTRVGSSSTISALFGSAFTDATDTITSGSSANTLAGIAVTASTSDAAKGVWQYKTNGTNTWANIPDVSSDSTAFVLASADAIGFLPFGDYNGPATTFAATMIDSSAKVTSGATVDASVRGGITPYSTGLVTVSTTVNPINDASVLSATLNNPTVVEIDGTNTSAGTSYVSLLSSSAVADLDFANSSFGGGSITVALNEYISGDVLDLPTGVTPAVNAVQISGSNVQISNGTTWTTVGTIDGTSTGQLRALKINLNSLITEANIGFVLDTIRYRNSSDNPTVNNT